MCDIRQYHTLACPVHSLALLCYSLASNLICDDGNMEGLNALVAAIKELPSLSSLKCASSRVPCPGSYLFRQVCGIGRWHSGLLTLSLLTCCSLNGNELGPEGITELAKALPECKALASLR